MASLHQDVPSPGFSEGFVGLVDALSAIRELSDIDLDKVSQQQLLQAALEILVRHQDLENCSLFLLQNDRLVCAAGTDAAAQLGPSGRPVGTGLDRSVTFVVGEGVMGLAARSGELQYCRDCRHDEYFRLLPEERRAEQEGSLMSVPVKIGDRVLGVLNVSHSSVDFFEPWHGHFLSLFANCLGRFYHTHRLLHDLDSMVRERASELEQALIESEDLRHRYQRLSTTDELTGLHNRRYFFAEGESMLARSSRYRLPVSLLLLDVDYFKRINDRWGHSVGDRVLRVIAGVLREEVRSGDLVARLGGEEFVMLLPNTGPVGADLMAKRIQERIGHSDLGGEMKEVALTVSIGMTTLSESGFGDDGPAADLNHLYRQADIAMYRCKREGRNRRMFYTPGMEDDSGTRD
ncbi:MAG TPA: GGDEF domain-containing protein [Sedimenticola thiotaurini]|uniref:diguanylate cyclase n=1 Tax=Sedimenticola thiotaurini TaxID=1543721 RepID=A0A831WBP6_9GAMM|nr:GGDEF domain-containing protein [Sedimenticola thiotaurini]